MPRTADEILNQAGELAKRFEDHEPVTDNIRSADVLRTVREAFQRRAASERELSDAVRAARTEGYSWATIGAMLGTSGEAARQRYGTTAGTRQNPKAVPSTAEIEFHKEVLAGSVFLKKAGYNPVRFLEMVHATSAQEAAKKLLQRADASGGFTTLWEMHMLDRSIEAMALLPWYSPLFTPDELANARRLLEKYDFDVEAYLARAAKSPPAWTRDAV